MLADVERQHLVNLQPLQESLSNAYLLTPRLFPHLYPGRSIPKLKKTTLCSTMKCMCRAPWPARPKKQAKRLRCKKDNRREDEGRNR